MLLENLAYMFGGDGGGGFSIDKDIDLGSNNNAFGFGGPKFEGFGFNVDVSKNEEVVDANENDTASPESNGDAILFGYVLKELCGSYSWKKNR